MKVYIGTKGHAVDDSAGLHIAIQSLGSGLQI